MFLALANTPPNSRHPGLLSLRLFLPTVLRPLALAFSTSGLFRGSGLAVSRYPAFHLFGGGHGKISHGQVLGACSVISLAALVSGLRASGPFDHPFVPTAADIVARGGPGAPANWPVVTSGSALPVLHVFELPVVGPSRGRPKILARVTSSAPPGRFTVPVALFTGLLAVASGHAACIFTGTPVEISAIRGSASLACLQIRHPSGRGRATGSRRTHRRLGAHVLAVPVPLLRHAIPIHLVSILGPTYWRFGVPVVAVAILLNPVPVHMTLVHTTLVHTVSIIHTTCRRTGVSIVAVEILIYAIPVHAISILGPAHRRTRVPVIAFPILLNPVPVYPVLICVVYVLGAAHCRARVPVVVLVVPGRVISSRGRARGDPAYSPTGGTIRIPVIRLLAPGGLSAPHAEVAKDPLFEVRGDLVIVTVVGGILDVFLGIGDFNPTLPLIDTSHLYRDQSSTRESEEAHLDTNILLAIGIIHEQVIHLTYLLTVAIID